MLSDLFCEQEPTKVLRCGFAWEGGSADYQIREVLQPADTEGHPVIERFDFQGPASMLGTWQPEYGTDARYELGDTTTTVAFEGLLPLGNPFRDQRQHLEEFGEAVHWLSAEREPPRQRYAIQKGTLLDERGSNVIPVLHGEQSDGPVLLEVRDWLQEVASCRLEFVEDALGVSRLPCRRSPEIHSCGCPSLV